MRRKKPALEIAPSTETRQRIRRTLFIEAFVGVTLNAFGQKKRELNPSMFSGMNRRQRRKLARAYATARWRQRLAAQKQLLEAA